MNRQLTTQLEKMGLSPAEARAYVALLKGPMGAQAVAEACGVTRTSGYEVLRSLVDRGLVKTGEGYGKTFAVAPPEEALPALVDNERASLMEELAEREAIAKRIASEVSPLVDQPPGILGDVVEILRNRRVVANRWARLQMEAQDEINGFVKAPFVASGGNPEEDVTLTRGVRVRAIYESAVLDSEEVRPYLERWVAAGEEARIFPGELPFKLQLFDAKTALMPLETPGEPQGLTSLVIHHSSLGAGLRILFDCLWEKSDDLG